MEEKTSIGKIKKVPLREIWKKEDRDFTRWLEENIDYLNEILDFDITIWKGSGHRLQFHFEYEWLRT